MPTEAPAKKFDCVRFMREARAEIDEETRGMSWEEFGRWLDRQRPTDPYLAALWDRAKPPAGRRTTRPES